MMDSTELLTEEDYQEMEDIINIKKQLFSYIDKKTLIDFVRNIVKESEYVHFKNSRAEKFIDNRRPVFNLTIDIDKCNESDKYKSLKNIFKNEEKRHNMYAKILNDEITTKFTSFINEKIHESQDLEDYILSREIFKDYQNDPEKLQEVLSIVTTIFACKFSVEQPDFVILELFL